MSSQSKRKKGHSSAPSDTNSRHTHVFRLTRDDLHDDVVAVETPSADMRRVHRATHPVPVSPAKTSQAQVIPRDDMDFMMDERFDWNMIGGGETNGDDDDADVLVVEVEGNKRYGTSDNPMREWVPLRDEYLAEFLRLDGPGDFDIGKCSRCMVQFDSANPLLFPTRCGDCFSGVIRCSNCCVKDHTRHPLHNIQKWNGIFFEKTTLRDLGLCVQLGHVPGSECVNPEPGPAEFSVIHTNGIHVINLNYCGCSGAGNRRQQLLRREWFPASQVIPQTCCTFRVLESFQTISLQSKISAYDFYGALAKLTDATGLDDVKDRYRVFGRLARQFHHTIMLKRGGRGHAASGAAGTSSGELALMCLACPRPGVNLSTSWRDADEEKR